MAESMILVLVFLASTFPGLTTPRVLQNTKVTLSCHNLKTKPEFRNFSVGQSIPSDDHLDICVNNDTTCCTRRMEQRLHTLSQINVRNIQTAKTDLIRTIFSEGVIKFNSFFEGHIDSSEKELDEEFTKVYKKAYVNNSDVTRSFYTKLRKHFKSGEFKTREIVDDFFKEVLKKMYLLLNGGQNSGINMSCISSIYDKLEPFGKVPRQLTPRLERSIAAARTMVRGLLSGKIVVEKLSDDKWFTDKCLQSVTKLSHCSVCAGHSDLKPCAGYCIDAHRECLSSLSEMEQIWDEYLVALTSLGSELDGRFDFEAATEMLPEDISDGIVNCQNALPMLTPKIKKYCEKGKRKTRSSELPSDNDFFLDVRVERSVHSSRRRPRYTLKRLISQYQRHFRKLKKFWTKLPDAMCDETVVANNATAYCWNGSRIVNNTAEVQRGKKMKLTSGQNDVIVSLVSQLRSTIKAINAAVAGKTVNPPSISDEDWEFSGSGSASGSGESGESGDDDEDEDNNNVIPTDDIDFTQSPDENSVDDTNEVLIVNPPDVKAIGGVRILHASVLLLVTTFVVQLL